MNKNRTTINENDEDEIYQHAVVIKDDLNYLKSRESRHNLRMLSNFNELLRFALLIVDAENSDEQQDAINELEEFLR